MSVRTLVKSIQDIMRQDTGWLQYIPTGAAAGTLMVWELS
jgi:hypothetical protein